MAKTTQEFITKVQLMDEQTMQRALMRISYEIIEKNADLHNLVLAGICTRGVPLAELIQKNIARHTQVMIPLISLDIQYYRDDLEKIAEIPQVKHNEPETDIDDKSVILVDDVLFTGRTVRAAIDALFDMGRPSRVQLAILVDRGHRELPFRADYVGKNVPTSLNEVVQVNIGPVDGKTNVELLEKKEYD